MKEKFEDGIITEEKLQKAANKIENIPIDPLDIDQLEYFTKLTNYENNIICKTEYEIETGGKGSDFNC